MTDKIYLKINGLNISRFVDKLINKGLCLQELKFGSNYVKFCVKRKDFDLFKSICKKERKCYEIISRSSIKNLFNGLRFCLGFVLAVVLTVSYLIAFSGVVESVKISYDSADNYDISKVEKILDEYGIKEGGYTKFSSKEIEQMLMTGLDDISGCSVIKKGSNLSVYIYPEVNNSVKSKELISKYDAVITEIDVFAGQSNFKVGDVVKRGDVLVFDETEAKASVKGKAYFSTSKIYNEKQQNVVYTGKYFVNHSVSMFNKNLYKQNKNNIFSQYLTKKCGFYLCENYFLPIFVESEYVFEIEIEEQIIPFEECEIDIKRELVDELKKNSNIDINESDISFSIVRDGSYVRIDCYAEIETELI